jgi:D-xylose transport system substrate-binding protein
MKRIKTLSFKLSCILFLFFTACSKEKVVVGFMLPNMISTRYSIEKDEFTKKINELGADVIFMNADNDEATQINQFDELMSRGIDILILDPVNRFNAAQMVRRAHDKGIKVISYDRLISNSDVDAYVTFDAKMIGTQMAEYVLRLKPEGNYVILGGDKMDINAVGIDQGQQEIIEPAVKSGKIKITYRIFIEKWSNEDARYEMLNYSKLTELKPDVILAASDGIAKGVVEALKENGFQGKVLVTGNGGEAATCKNIMLGYQVMTVYKPVKKLAVLAADLVFKMLNKENVNNILTSTMYNGKIDVPSSLLETIPVDASNLRSTVLADGMVTEEDLK